MARNRKHTGFTLVELLLVTAVLAVLAGILLAVLGPARKMAQVTSCTSNLRQIGLAFQMYLADYDQYPEPGEFTLSPYLKGRRILFCPEDTSFVTKGMATSYRFRLEVPPDFIPLARAHALDPHVVLTGCQHHLAQRTIVLKGDNTRLTPPAYPFHLVLRAGGNAERVHLSRIRQSFLPGDPPILMPLYPGEPGYTDVRS